MLEKEEKTHSHRQQKSSSFNPYAETKRRSKKINETNKIKRRHVCRMYLCSGFFYRQKREFLQKRIKNYCFTSCCM